MRHLLISGNPAVGKSTLVREIVNAYRDVVGGFMTLERRGEDGEREGFEIMSFPEGRRALFASKNISGQAKFNKYGLDLNVLDSMGVASIERALEDDRIRLVVIDEIGSMEMESAAFRQSVVKALMGVKPVLATAQAQPRFLNEDEEFSGRLEKLELTRANFAEVKKRAAAWLARVLNENWK